MIVRIHKLFVNYLIGDSDTITETIFHITIQFPTISVVDRAEVGSRLAHRLSVHVNSRTNSPNLNDLSSVVGALTVPYQNNANNLIWISN